MIRWDWRTPKNCAACGFYRRHDNHISLDLCNTKRPHDPCDKPDSHHPFVLKVEPPTEPRRTIVREMATSWQEREVAKVCFPDMVDEDRLTLAAIRRIWHAAREEN
jgi:hypothetical protein